MHLRELEEPGYCDYCNYCGYDGTGEHYCDGFGHSVTLSGQVLGGGCIDCAGGYYCRTAEQLEKSYAGENE